jgi:hypothetical protein
MTCLVIRLDSPVSDNIDSPSPTIHTTYTHCDDLGAWANAKEEELEWERRWPQLQAEVLRTRPDVIGLAECNNYAGHWRPFLSAEVTSSRFYIPL